MIVQMLILLIWKYVEDIAEVRLYPAFHPMMDRIC